AIGVAVARRRRGVGAGIAEAVQAGEAGGRALGTGPERGRPRRRRVEGDVEIADVRRAHRLAVEADLAEERVVALHVAWLAVVHAAVARTALHAVTRRRVVLARRAWLLDGDTVVDAGLQMHERRALTGMRAGIGDVGGSRDV